MNTEELKALILAEINQHHEVGETEKTDLETFMHQTDSVGVTEIYCRFRLERANETSGHRAYGAVEFWIGETNKIITAIWLSLR